MFLLLAATSSQLRQKQPFFRYGKSWFKIYAKVLKNNIKDFILCSVDNCLKYFFMFKLIPPASPNILSLKAADKNSSYAFFFFHYGYLAQDKKSTSTTQAQLPVIYVSIFKKLVNFCFKINQPAPLFPVFVADPKLLKWYKKDQIFHSFSLWFGPLVFQHCCGTDLRKISLVMLK